MAYGDYDGPDKASKGKEGGACNRTRCQADYERRVLSAIEAPAAPSEVTEPDPEQEAYQIGKRDGYDEAVQDIDRLTGGDGEYRYVMGAGYDDERHTPDAETMKLRIIDRFAAISALGNDIEDVDPCAWLIQFSDGSYDLQFTFEDACARMAEANDPNALRRPLYAHRCTPGRSPMTALNSEGLEKALEKAEQQAATRGDNVTCSSLNIGYDEVRLILSAARSHLSALPPVDGMEVVAWDVAPKGLPAEPTKSHSFVAEIEKQGGVISPLVALSQASSIIAGLTAERDAAQASAFVWENRFVLMDGAYNREFSRAQAAEARISSLEEENKRLREVVSASAAALSNGAFILPKASLEFMEMLPLEIGKFCDRLEGDNTHLQRKLDLLETTVSFVRRWAIEKEGNDTSAEERLSAIANHPGVKGFQIGDHNG